MGQETCHIDSARVSEQSNGDVATAMEKRKKDTGAFARVSHGWQYLISFSNAHHAVAESLNATSKDRCTKSRVRIDLPSLHLHPSESTSAGHAWAFCTTVSLHHIFFPVEWNLHCTHPRRTQSPLSPATSSYALLLGLEVVQQHTALLTLLTPVPYDHATAVDHLPRIAFSIKHT